MSSIKHSKYALSGLLGLLLFFSALAQARPVISVEVLAEKQIVIEENGKQISKRVPTVNIESGEIIFYTLVYKNTGDTAALDVALNDPIPENTHYIAGSVTGDNVVFSIDGGETYNKPDLLTYVFKNMAGKEKIRVASPEMYTDIRWVVAKMGAGQSGQVSFQVKVQ